MDEKQRIGQAWNDLLKTFDQREMKRTLKDAYRRTGKMIAAVAKRSVEGSGINDAGKLAKGVRVRVYPRGGGFMITVKPHGKSGYIKNRHGLEKPVLMWAAEGTVERYPRSWAKRFLVNTGDGSAGLAGTGARCPPITSWTRPRRWARRLWRTRSGRLSRTPR